MGGEAGVGGWRSSAEIAVGSVHATSNAWVPIGPFAVLDASSAGVVARLVEGTAAGIGHVAYDLHVGAFLKAGDREFVEVMNRGDTVYADGLSVVLLAKLAGAASIERAATTDIGWDVLREVRDRVGRPARIALIGGPPGLATRAGAVIEQSDLGTCVAATDGFQDSYSSVLEVIRDGNVEIVLVGMGMPLEAFWVERHRESLGSALVMTCGGWFGFVVGDERRAPGWLQRIGMEWAWRMAQAPGRLSRRYALGALRTAMFIPPQLRVRRSAKKARAVKEFA